MLSLCAQEAGIEVPIDFFQDTEQLTSQCGFCPRWETKSFKRKGKTITFFTMVLNESAEASLGRVSDFARDSIPEQLCGQECIRLVSEGSRTKNGSALPAQASVVGEGSDRSDEVLLEVISGLLAAQAFGRDA